MMVSTGIMSMQATSLGATRKGTGSSAEVSRAIISSLTFMVPISAAMAAPANPLIITAASSGPSSRTMDTPTTLPT